MTIVGIAGSLRKNSFNAGLLRAAAEVVSPDTRLEILSIGDVPLYNFDVEETSGVPPAVQQIKDRVAASDGVLLVTPEYNNSIPGVFKNVIDWMSRPPADIKRIFTDRPVALMGATPGMGGTLLAQAAWLPVFRTLQMRPWFGGRLSVSNSRQSFDAQGNLIDDKVRDQLKTFVAGFEGFIRKKQGGI